MEWIIAETKICKYLDSIVKAIGTTMDTLSDTYNPSAVIAAMEYFLGISLEQIISGEHCNPPATSEKVSNQYFLIWARIRNNAIQSLDYLIKLKSLPVKILRGVGGFSLRMLPNANIVQRKLMRSPSNSESHDQAKKTVIYWSSGSTI